MSTSKPRVIVIGAGASGRGHVGQLAFESGYDLVFLDRDRTLVDRLRSARRYDVRLVSRHTRDVTVTGFEVFHTDETDRFFDPFKDIPLVFTSVCAQNLPAVADHLSPLLKRWLADAPEGDYKNILCCENMNSGSTVLRNMLRRRLPAPLGDRLDRAVGFPDSMISRVVATPKDPLHLLGEEYSEWTAHRGAFRGSVLPEIRTLELVDNQEKYLRRKLYIHNTGHATFGYLGFLSGYTYVHEAALDPHIMEATKKAIEESGWAIHKEYGFSEQTLLDYRNALTDKCTGDALPDELIRVVRDPMRKLGPDERFFGPIGLMLKHGRGPEHLLYGLCAALLTRIPNDAESATIEQIVRDQGVSALLDRLHVTVPTRVVDAIDRLLPHVRDTFGAKR